MENKKYKAPAVEKLLEILELMASINKSFSVTELGMKLDIPVNSIFRIMKELEIKNYVYKNPLDSTYQLTDKLYYLGSSTANRITLRNVSQESLRRLLEYTRETVILTKFGVDYQTLIIDQIESPEPLKFISTIGLEYPSHASAMGKAMLAYLSDEDLSSFLDRKPLVSITLSTITDMIELKKELVKIRNDGCAFDHEESCYGLRCVAAPVFNSKGMIEGAIGISGPSFRVTETVSVLYAEKIKAEAKTISELLGYFGSYQR